MQGDLIQDQQTLLTLIKEQKVVINSLLKRVICSTAQRKIIRKAAMEHIAILLGGKGSDEFIAHKRSAIRYLWMDFHKDFKIDSYINTPESRFEEVLAWIGNWKLPGRAIVSGGF